MNKILDFLKHIRLPNIGRRPGSGRTLSVRWIIFWGVALLIAAVAFVGVRALTTCWRLTVLPGMPPASCGAGGLNPLGQFAVTNGSGAPADLPPTPEVAAPEVTYPTWDGGSRINIVFFGLRGGETAGEGCPQCTDTIIVFTVDPLTKSAGMVSVPRDMYVNIPGYNYGRINTAWTLGEANKVPGGGPALAMQTVSQFLGVPIQYYVQIDFDTFVQIIDLIHGIDIYSDENLVIKKLGGGKDGIRITCCGMRHLGGQAALAYARCREASQGCTDGDVGRSNRQQKVILGIRDKVLDPRWFPTLMGEAPQLYNTFQSGIRTNMTLDEAIRLAMLVNDIPVDRIQRGLIDDHMVNYGNVTLGGQNASVLMPIPDKIRVLRDQIFTVGGPTSPLAQGDPKALMQADGARVEVTNDSYTANLDSRTGNFLVAQGMQVTMLGTATGAINQTVVVVYSPKLYTLRYLIQPLGMITGSNQIIFKPDPSSPVDIEIRLGADWAGKLPAGY